MPVSAGTGPKWLLFTHKERSGFLGWGMDDHLNWTAYPLHLLGPGHLRASLVPVLTGEQIPPLFFTHVSLGVGGSRTPSALRSLTSWGDITLLGQEYLEHLRQNPDSPIAQQTILVVAAGCPG